METTVNTTTEGRPDFISIRDFSFFYAVENPRSFETSTA